MTQDAKQPVVQPVPPSPAVTVSQDLLNSIHTFVNEDAWHYFVAAPDVKRGNGDEFAQVMRPEFTLTKKGLENYIDEIARGHVTHFVMNLNSQRANFPSKTFEPLWKSLDEPERDHLDYIRAMKALYESGVDPYQVWIDRCRVKGIQPWISVRMNDMHRWDEPKSPNISTLWHEHPEYRLRPEGWENGFDYTLEPVRKRMLDFITEVLDRYDPDGLELDLMRFWHYLPIGREKECAPIFTAYMREIRKVVHAAAAKRGHTITLSVRLRSKPSESRKLGMEADVWAKEGIVDMIVPTSPWESIDFDIPLAEWRSWTGDKVPVFPSADDGVTENGKRRSATFEDYRHWARIMHERGAKGLYLFNLFLHPQDGPVWNGVLSGGLAPLAALQAAEPVTIDLAKRTWQGIPGLERTAKGRVFLSWFTGGTWEPEPENTVVLSQSDDGGKTFSAPQAMGLPLNDGTRCYDPCLWIDPKGRLWYLFNRSIKDSTQHGVYARICDAPDASPPVWGAEFRVGFDGPFSFRMNKPVVLSTGEWVLPVVHALEPVAGWAGFDAKQVFGAAISTDEGKTWKLHGAIKTAKAGLENMIVELKDGRLWMLIRTEKVLWESHSSDKGRTWTPGKPTTIATPHSRFFIRRLSSGNLLLVNHYKFTGRSHLTAQLSTDDGATWNEGLLLDERGGLNFPGGLPISYPDGAQDKDGLIWITYDRDRGGVGEILLAKFKEEDVVAGKDVSGAVSLKQVVNKLNKPASAPKPAVKVTQELLNSIHVTPKLIFDPMPAYGQKYLPFAMAASMESTQKGRLWTCWAGGQDGPNAYLLASYTDDQGKSWRDPVFVIDPQAHGLKMGTRLGSFWCDPRGRLWLFFHQSVGMFDGSCSNWFVRCDAPDAEKPVWTDPVYIGFGASLNKPIVRQNGEWLLPVSLWERWHIDKPFADCYHELDAVRGSDVFVSDDEGGHWRYRGGIIFKNSCFNEHSVVEQQDGRLWMLSRCMKEIAQSVSDDGGKTWKPQSTFFSHVNSKAVFRRLQSGNLLLVKHGQDMLTVTPDRRELTAFLSTDDGKSWSGGLLLDERPGVSYPDIAQDPNGDIYVHYDRNRASDAEILFARIREDDVQAGRLVSAGAALKNLVKSKAGMNRGGLAKNSSIGTSVVSALEAKVAKFREDLPLLLVPPRVREFNEPKLLQEGTQMTAFPGIARTPGGRLWVCWGAGEDGPGGYSMMASSDDDGKTWSGPRYILKEPPTPNGFPRSANGTFLWTDPRGRLWWFIPYSLGIFDGRAGIWAAVCENPDADKLEWSVPRRLADGEYVNKPVILRDGAWLLSATLFPRRCIGVRMGDLNDSDLFRELDPWRMSNFLISMDLGATWERRGGVTAPPEDWDWDEPHFIEKSSGELRCLLRTKYGLCESRSFDGGFNWSQPEPSKLVHPSSRIFTMKLQSGKVLLIKHGQLFEKTGRTHLRAYLSDDEGETWYGGLLLDERHCSYPDGIQSPDGRIHIVYDQKRIDGRILMAVFREEDVRAGKLVSKDALPKTLVRSAVRVKQDGADTAISPKENR